MTTLTLLNNLDSGGEHTAIGAVGSPPLPPAALFEESPPQETRFVCSSNAPDSAVAVVERSAVATRTMADRRLRSVVGFEKEDERGSALTGLAFMTGEEGCW